MVLLCK
jgi:hypothetical protein